jgi:hypothetical protein
MAKTVTEADLKKPTSTTNSSSPSRSESDTNREEQGWGRLIWIIAPVALVAAVATFLVVRLWLNSDESAER